MDNGAFHMLPQGASQQLPTKEDGELETLLQ